MKIFLLYLEILKYQKKLYVIVRQKYFCPLLLCDTVCFHKKLCFWFINWQIAFNLLLTYVNTYNAVLLFIYFPIFYILLIDTNDLSNPTWAKAWARTKQTQYMPPNRGLVHMHQPKKEEGNNLENKYPFLLFK